MGLLVPDTSDPFVTADIAANWSKLDAYPGVFICTSGTRPTWALAQKGLSISEKDTGLRWQWDGTAFVRQAPTGLLKTSTGAWARGQLLVDKNVTNQTTPQVVCSINNVVVPDGHRPLRIDVNWQQSSNPNGNFNGYIVRSLSAGGTPQLVRWVLPGNSTIGGSGGSFFVMEPNGLAAGTYDYSFQIMVKSSVGGTATISADSASPSEIIVTEL